MLDTLLPYRIDLEAVLKMYLTEEQCIATSTLPHSSEIALLERLACSTRPHLAGYLSLQRAPGLGNLFPRGVDTFLTVCISFYFLFSRVYPLCAI